MISYRIIGWFAASLFSLSACGETPVAGKPAPNSHNAEQTIRQNLEKHYSGQLKITNVTPTPVKGLYEISTSDRQIAYTDAEGRYVIVGELVDLHQNINLTAQSAQELNKLDFGILPLDKAITEVRGNGKLKVAVFTDIDCPFCRRLEREFSKTDNLTIYNFMMPLSFHPDAPRKSIQILCQNDPVRAWTQYMREGKTPPQVSECPNPLQETMALGERLGFNGTPTMVFPNGKIHSGYLPADELIKMIEQNQ